MVRVIHSSPLLGKPGSVVASTLFPIFASLVFIAVIARYCFYDAYDPFKCDALLKKGRWLDEPRSGTVPKVWQPPGCIIRKYKSKDIESCLQDKKLLFIGDSTIRQVFWTAAKALDPTVDSTKGDKHSDHVVSKGQAKIEFIWDPYLNSSRLDAELQTFVDDNVQSPAALLAGGGLWHSRYVEQTPVAQWKTSIDNILRYMRWAKRTAGRPKSDLLLLAPVTVPDWDKLSMEKNETILPEEIDMMTKYLQRVTDVQSAHIFWAFSEFAKGRPEAFDDTGIYTVDSIATLKVDALLNLRCNSERQFYPYDGTCCNSYKTPNYVQWAVLVTMIMISLTSFCYNGDKTSSASTEPTAIMTKIRPIFPSERNHAALMTFALAVVFCFYADRTQVFNKSFKLYKNSEFFGLSILVIIVGLLSIRRSSTDTRTADVQPFLGRDQTDEWKGWMQLAILIYHCTGASKIDWIYKLIRFLVASYLFMTGYGHTIYFYNKKDYSFKRVSSVLIRLKLLSLTLPYMMGTDYLFYYFAPLVSYWFIIVYLTMGIGKKYNVNNTFLIGKIILSAILTTAFNKVPGVLELCFWALKTAARIDWNVTEWRFRVSLDMWIVYFGMLVAIIYIKLDHPNSPLMNSSRWATYTLASILLSAITLPGYFMFQAGFQDKAAYNILHPYFSFIPIISFIILRNATPGLRNAYSGVYAWVGKCSLETFTLQFHIWMAADTHGLLDYGIFGNARWLNFTVSTIMFIYASNRVAAATGDLTTWILSAQGEVKGPSGPRPPRMPRLPVLPTTSERSEVEMQPLATVAKSNGHAERAEKKGTEANGGINSNSKSAISTAPATVRKLYVKMGVWLLVMWLLNLTYK
ncbi:10 TM acyl transferase domain found in Cas1p-domain-containing protein [Kalaharituber pfeilii]|nr:10 TM acyl transferase domain found in Cas1p-domain-containing protein [Kalaharituber pfeilii]